MDNIKSVFKALQTGAIIIQDTETGTRLLLEKELESALYIGDDTQSTREAVIAEFIIQEVYLSAKQHILDVGLEEFIDRISDNHDKVYFYRYWLYCTGITSEYRFVNRWAEDEEEGCCILEINQKIDYKSRSEQDVKEHVLSSKELVYSRPPDVPPHYEQFELIVYVLESLINDLRLDEMARNHLFTIPSRFDTMALFFHLLGAKETRLPKGINKSADVRTDSEVNRINSFIDKSVKTKKRNIGLDDDGNQISETKRYYQLDNPNSLYKGCADFSIPYFNEDPIFQTTSQILKTFSIQGLRHLLALLIAFDLNGRRSVLEWDVNNHLDILGYQRKSDGSHHHKNKQAAIEIIRVLTEARIVIDRKDEKANKKRVFKLFNVWVYDAVIDEHNRVSVDAESGKMTIEVNPWYSEAYTPAAKDQSPQFTQMLKRVVTNNHQQHGTALFLSALLSIYWRMNGIERLKVDTLLSWCGLERKKKCVKRLEDELEFMRKHEYLGEWTHDGEAGKCISECKNSYDVVVRLIPPRWFMLRLKGIKSGKLLEIQSEKNNVSVEEFQSLMASYSVPNTSKVADLLDVSRQFISSILNGEKKIPAVWTREYIEMRFRGRHKRSGQDRVAG